MRIAVATNEPWGTYHLRPLLPLLAERPDVSLVHVVPDLDGVPDGPSATLHAGPHLEDVDLLVVTGATAWPAKVAAANPTIPVVASCLAYMNPERAAAAEQLAHRIRWATAASPADANAFAGHLGINAEDVQVVGNPVLDDTTEPTRTGHTLVLTSVTRADATGGSAPGTSLLAVTVIDLLTAGHDVVVRLHPREDRRLWHTYPIDDSPNARAAAAGARLVVGIPGTAFAEVAAQGIPLAGVVAPGLQVPDHLLNLCGTHIRDISQAGEWARAGALTPPASADHLAAAVGPVGGAAPRLLEAWVTAATT